MKFAFAFINGLIFGVGIAISGMANPAKVLNFFDIAGHWDPSLMLVMGGALVTTFVGYQLVLKRSRPVLADIFQLPTTTKIDGKLIGGAAIFGIGWGISGFCPGGAIPALGTGNQGVFFFTGAMAAGILAARAVLLGYNRRRSTKQAGATAG